MISRKLWTMLVIGGLLAGLLASPVTTAAAPQAGYGAGTIFTTDPEDPDSETTSFTTADKMVVAWLYCQATEGSPAKGFEIGIEFYTPGGREYESKWYDDEQVTCGTEITGDAVARKYVEIAGTAAANETGQWSVKFYVNGKLLKIESFTLSGDKTAAGPVTDVQAYLEAQGYKVYLVEEGQLSSGGTYAYVRMDMASNDLYSSEVSDQLYHACYALRNVYPEAETLACGLMFGGKYEVVFFALASDWDAFYGGGSWSDFVQKLKYGVLDRETNQPLSSAAAKNFMTKNFGTAGRWTPPRVAPGKGNPSTGMISSVKVEIKPDQVPADGKSTAEVKVTVYDRDNQPLGDAQVEFKLSGSAATGCRIRPTVTTTDSNGKATATFTAGTTNGTVNVTARVKSVTGLAVVTIGTGESPTTDPKVQEIIAFLTKYGYKVHGAGYLTDQQGNKTGAVAVVMDMASNTFDEVLAQQLVLGWLVLYQSYPDAQALFVILYYDRYALFFGTTPVDLAVAIKAGDVGDQQTVTAFWNKVFANLIIVDRDTGERVTDTRGFIQKNFTKGGGGGF